MENIIFILRGVFPTQLKCTYTMYERENPNSFVIQEQSVLSVCCAEADCDKVLSTNIISIGKDTIQYTIAHIYTCKISSNFACEITAAVMCTYTL